MPELIEDPVRVEAAGEPPKLIDEFAGRASNGEERVSVARMRSPAGWSEPGQRPEFDEYTVVLAGALHVETEDGELEVPGRQGDPHARRRVGALLHARRARSTWPYACPPSRRTPSTATTWLGSRGRRDR